MTTLQWSVLSKTGRQHCSTVQVTKTRSTAQIRQPGMVILGAAKPANRSKIAYNALDRAK